MRFLFLLTGLLYHCLSFAQAPSVVKAVAGTTAEPKNKDQEGWKSNEWNGKFFYQGTGTGVKLCVTDGTNAGTIFVADLSGTTLKATLPAQDFMYIITNGASFSPSFTSTDYIYQSDGTAAGTSLVFTMPAITSFSTTNAWTSNRDLTKNFSISGNTMYFGGYDAANGNELWVTDGTAAGTHIVKDLKAGTGSSNPFAFCKIGSDVFFTATAVASERKLWKTDGTAAGTVQIPVAEPFFILDNAVGLVNNKMIFYAHNTVDGYEPYVSDGTAAGTFMLANINPAGNSWLSQSQNAHLRFNSKYVFFAANNGTANALWRTDGTSAGTIQLTTNAQAVASDVSGGGYTDIDETGLWMIQYDGLASGANNKLYRSDGTIAGTYQVATGLSYAQYLKIYKSGLWMQSRNTGSPANAEPWRSGGNAATTGKAFEIAPGNSGSPSFTPISSSPFGFFVKNNKLYFFASSNTAPDRNLYEYQGGFTFNGSLAGGRWIDSANWNGLMPPGIVDSVFINSGTPNALNITGATAYAGSLIMGSNATANLVNNTDSLIINSRVAAAANNSFTGSGVLVLRNVNTDSTVLLNTGFTAGRTGLQTNALLLAGNINITGNLNITGSSKFFANGSTVTLQGTGSTITQQGALNYIVTGNGGKLFVENIGPSGRAGSFLFPIGSATSYRPLVFQNTGTDDTFGAGVTDNIYSSYSGETPVGATNTTGAVGSTWFITEQIPGGSNANITLQWSQADELSGFDRSQAYTGHYTAGSWNLGAVASASGTNPYTLTRTGITSFSPFGVLNNNATLPLNFLFFTAQKCNTNNVCLNWKTANEQNVSHFEIQRSIDGRSFTTIKPEPAKNQPLNLYSYADDISGISAANVYYRIKETGTDGKSSFSNIQAVTLPGSNKISLYPNPVTETITISGQANIKHLQLVNAGGQIVLNTAFVSSAINVKNLPAGTYILRVLLNSGEIIHREFVKQ